MPPSPVSTVVVLNDFAHVQGGASKVAIDEATALAELGLRVVFLASVGPVAPQLAASAVEVICLDQRQLLDVARHPGVVPQSMWNRAAYRRMHALLATLDPARTAVHLHGSSKALSGSPVRAAHRAGFRVVCTLHDFFSACPNGAFFDFVRMEPCPRVALSVDCALARCDKRRQVHKWFRVARSLAQRDLAGFPRLVGDYITLSRRSADILRPYLPPDARLHPLANWVEVERRPPVRAAENRTLVCVGRLDEEKGVRVLADAAEAAGLECVFVGDGPFRNEVAAHPRARVTGWLPPAGVMAELEQARCLVFPSLWYETFGLTVDEAAARGIPAIVSDVTAPAERVRDGETGWHVRANDRAALAEVLARTRDDATIAAMGAAAYEGFWARAQTRREHAEALVGIYEGMLRDRGMDA